MMFLFTTLVRVAVLLAAKESVPEASLDAPDPRQGERLDGRVEVAPASDPALALPRLLLSPVRAVAWAVLTPIDRATGFAERHKLYDRAYEALTSDDRRRGVRPLLRYESDSAIAAGLRVFDRSTLGPASYLGALLRAGPSSLDGGVRVEPPGATGWQLRLAYGRRLDALYGGGTGLPRDDLRTIGQPVVRYGYQRMQAVLSYQRRLGQTLELALSAGLDRRSYRDGNRSSGDLRIEEVYCLRAAQGCTTDPTLVPGFVQGVRLARGEADLRLDTRVHPRYGSGLLGSLSGSFAQGIAGDQSRHLTVRGGVGAVRAFGDRAFRLELRAGLVEPLGEAEIPFEELLSPTGQDGLRALSLGRLRGRSDIVASAEYRWLLAAWLDAILFVDRGNVFAPRFGDLSLERRFTSVGLGLVAFDLDEATYWRSAPRYGVQMAVTGDGGLRWSFALHAW